MTDEINSLATSLDEERRRIARMTDVLSRFDHSQASTSATNLQCCFSRQVHGAEAVELKMTLERTKSELQKALLDAQRERGDEAQRAFDAERELRSLQVVFSIPTISHASAIGWACR